MGQHSQQLRSQGPFSSCSLKGKEETLGTRLHSQIDIIISPKYLAFLTKGLKNNETMNAPMSDLLLLHTRLTFLYKFATNIKSKLQYTRCISVNWRP